MSNRNQLATSPGASLIRRAVLGVVLAELLCMVALATLSILHERQLRLRSTRIMLEGRADSLFGAIQDAEDATDTVRLDPRELKIPRGDFFTVYDAGGRQIGASEHTPADLLHLRPTSAPPFYTRHIGRHSYRVLQRGYLRIVDRGESPTSGIPRPVTIVYATELDRIWHEVFEAIKYYIGISVALTLGTTLVLVALLQRILRPIQALASAAAAVSPRNLTFQAPHEALAVRELRPLALTLTTMIEELRLTFDRQHRFLGDAAHELKTAVAVVRSSLQLMLLRPRSAAAYEQGLRAAVHDNERAEQLIARMLLMARLEEPQQQQQPSLAQADLQQAVQDCLLQLAPLIEQAELHIDGQWSQWASLSPATEQQPRPVRLVAIAPEDLEILISNLLVNAVEHSSPGTSIVVRVRQEELAACLEVIDHGEGIPPEALDHIFERFFRADQSRTRVTGGAGLGLSIAKAIVDSTGGTISATSRLGQGTTMTVHLPFQSDGAEPLSLADRSPSGADPSSGEVKVHATK